MVVSRNVGLRVSVKKKKPYTYIKGLRRTLKLYKGKQRVGRLTKRVGIFLISTCFNLSRHFQQYIYIYIFLIRNMGFGWVFIMLLLLQKYIFKCDWFLYLRVKYFWVPARWDFYHCTWVWCHQHYFFHLLLTFQRIKINLANRWLWFSLLFSEFIIF